MNTNEIVGMEERPKAARIAVPATLVTIDSESTLDIDDAISVEALPDGGFKALVCIADPTKLVLPGSTEDENAKLLGATVYVRDAAVRKMLPGLISENKGSLVAGHPRKAFVFEVILDQALEVTSFLADRQAITVSHRLIYEDIPQILQEQEHACFGLASAASTLAHGLLAKRRGRGAMVLYDLQRMIYMDEEGRLRQLARKDQVVGHIVVQEMMILANTQLARYMVDNDVPGLFRNHVAKAAAPDAAELATTMETWLRSGATDLDQARELFTVMLGKASYGATARGHYALAEACYVHGTSPLRRYADLVNLRQLRSFLKRAPYTYDRAELEALGEELTVKAAERKEERSEGFKRVVQANAARALETGAVQRLADHELVQAIKLGATADSLPEVLTAEICRRLERSLVTDKITDALFVTLPTSLWPQELRTAFAEWTSLVPTRAVHLLMHGAQTGYLSDVLVTATGEGTAFEGLVRVSNRGETKESRARGSRKRDAEQAACVAAVHWLIGVEANDAAALALANTGRPAVAGNPKGALMELCQKRGWNPPVFTSNGQGPSHAMIFSCEAALTQNGERLVGAAKGAASKKEAEAIASADLLAKLMRQPSDQPTEAPGQAAATSGANPIGALQELAQRKKWPAPEYAYTTLSQVPPKFRATVSVAGPKRGNFSGEASTKQEAKALAARAALAAQ